MFFIISGGVLLEENPWNCTCNLLWLGQWLRRWLRETFHVNMLSIEAALYVNTVSRNAKCFLIGSNTSISIIDLRKSDVQCERAISLAASLVPCYWTIVAMFICLGVPYVNFAQKFLMFSVWDKKTVFDVRCGVWIVDCYECTERNKVQVIFSKVL